MAFPTIPVFLALGALQGFQNQKRQKDYDEFRKEAIRMSPWTGMSDPGQKEYIGPITGAVRGAMLGSLVGNLAGLNNIFSSEGSSQILAPKPDMEYLMPNMMKWNLMEKLTYPTPA